MKGWGIAKKAHTLGRGQSKEGNDGVRPGGKPGATERTRR